MATLPRPVSERSGLVPNLLEPFYRVLNGFFGSVGLNTPTKRAFVGAIVGYFLQEVTKEKWGAYFHRSGKGWIPKRWSVTKLRGVDSGKSYAESDHFYTAFPWWMYPVSGAVIMGMFI